MLLVHVELINAARDARALEATFSIDPAAALARLQQDLPTTEVGQEQGEAGVTMDEVVLLALLSQLTFFATSHRPALVSCGGRWRSCSRPTCPTSSRLCS